MQTCDKQTDLWSVLLYLEELIVHNKLAIYEVAKYKKMTPSDLCRCVEIIQESMITQPKIWSNTLTLLAIHIVKQYDENIAEKLQGKLVVDGMFLLFYLKYRFNLGSYFGEHQQIVRL